MRMSKKLAAAAAVAVVGVAVSASSAMADNGVVVTNTGTPLTAGASSGVFTMPASVGGGTFDCSSSMSQIDVGEDGALRVRGFTIQPGDPWCNNYAARYSHSDADGDYWPGQICYNDSTGAFEAHIETSLSVFGLPLSDGETVGSLGGAQVDQPVPAVAPDAMSVHGAFGTTYGLDAEFYVENLDGTTLTDSGAGGCAL